MKITEDFLLENGFERINHGDFPPYESFQKDNIDIWDLNGQFWIITALDEAGIDVEFKTVEQLMAFCSACGVKIEPA